MGGVREKVLLWSNLLSITSRAFCLHSFPFAGVCMLMTSALRLLLGCVPLEYGCARGMLSIKSLPFMFFFVFLLPVCWVLRLPWLGCSHPPFRPGFYVFQRLWCYIFAGQRSRGISMVFRVSCVVVATCVMTVLVREASSRAELFVKHTCLTRN